MFQKINLSSILYLQADDDYSICFTKEGTFRSHLRLRELEDLLERHFFFRVHRSYFVNLRNATSVDLEKCQINFSGCRIPFSRRVKSSLKQQLLNLQIKFTF